MKIEERIKERLEENRVKYEVEEVEVTKNNGMVLNGFRIGKADSNVRCNIYVDKNKQIEEDDLVEQVVKQYLDAEDESIEDAVKLIKDKEYVLQNVVPCVVNLEKNKEIFDEHDIAYKPFLDCAITLRIKLKSEAENKGTVKITNAMLKNLDLAFEDVIQTAYDNIEDEVEIRPIWDIVREMMGLPEGMEDPMANGNPMFVVSTKDKMFGGSVIANDSILARAREVMDCNEIFVLPSSIHELILIPKTGRDYSPEILRNMVCEVNGSEVAEDEVLSDNVYVNSQEGTLVA